jgi:carnitine-CoA ligase
VSVLENGRPGPVAASEQWTGVARTTLLEFVSPRLAAGGDRPAVLFDDGFALTCEVLLDRAERLAAGLARRIGPGDRVVLAVGNRAEFLIAYLAILANRAVVVTTGPGIRSQDARHVLADSGAVLAIARPEAAAVLAEAGAPAVLEVGENEPDGLAAYHDGDERIALDGVRAAVEEITDIGYTSGTTGLPKALPGVHDDLLRYADVLLREFRLTSEDRFLCPLQFHYGDPLWLLFASLDVGTPLIVMRRFSVSRFWAVAREYRATVIITIGSIPNLLLTAPPSPAERDHAVRAAIAVGVPKAQHAELVERFGFPWLEYYGSSESGPALAMPEAMAERYVGTGALGVPVPEIEARLVDGDGVPLDGPAAGELELRGAVLFDGYLGNPAATAEVLHDGWLRTGDLMRRDADGVYYFSGRRKELIRRGGENVAPAEVEAVLRLHPSVVDAAVVPVEDALRGEEVKAYVEVRDGDPVEPAALVAFCAERLAPFKVPRYVELRTEPFPRTPSLRIVKSALAAGGAHRTDTAWDREAADGR